MLAHQRWHIHGVARIPACGCRNAFKISSYDRKTVPTMYGLPGAQEDQPENIFSECALEAISLSMTGSYIYMGATCGDATFVCSFFNTDFMGPRYIL